MAAVNTTSSQIIKSHSAVMNKNSNNLNETSETSEKDKSLSGTTSVKTEKQMQNTTNQKPTKSKLKFSQAKPRARSLNSSTDWESKFITHTELEDEQGNPKQNFSIYDNMQAHWNFNIPAGIDLKSGDTMSVSIPSVLILQNDASFDIKDVSGKIIGHAAADHNTGKVSVTFTDYAEESVNAEIKGDFKIWIHSNHSQVDENTDITIDWGTNGQTIHVGSQPLPNPDEVMAKWGYVDSNDSTLIHWTVRLNLAHKEIRNGVYTDFIGKDNKLCPEQF